VKLQFVIVVCKGLDGATLKLTSSSLFSCCYVHMSLLPKYKLKHDGILATLLLDNPVGQNIMSYEIVLKCFCILYIIANIICKVIVLLEYIDLFVTYTQIGKDSEFTDYISEGSVSHINDVWPIFLFEQLFTVYAPSG